MEDLSGVALFLPSAALVEGSEELIQRLAERRVSVVLASSEGGERPDLTAAADAAEAAGLPLLELSPRATFRETSQLVATKVLAQATHVLEYGTRVHRMLGDVFARGAGLTGLTQTMTQLSGTTVMVLGSSGDLLACAAPGPSAGRPSAEPPERVIEALRERGYFGHDPHDDWSPHVITLEIDGESRNVIVTPVRVAGEPYGVLALLEPTYPTAEHDLAQHMVMAEQGVSLTGSELLRQHSVRDAEERARNDFVHALLHGRFTDQLELAARSEHYRFPLDGRFAVFIVTSTGLRPDDSTGRRRALDAALAAREVSPGDGRLTLSALIGSMIVIVRQVSSAVGTDGDGLEEGRRLRSYGEQLHRAMRRRLTEDVRVTYGRPANGAAGVARSYREARTAEKLGQHVSTSPVCAYQDLRVFAAIQESATSPAGLAFATDILAPLKQAGGQTPTLEEVVLAYIEESGNLNATARRLHLHRNTMLYKLDRASRALHLDVRTTEAQFMIWLAHHIRALSEVVGQLDDELSPPR